MKIKKNYFIILIVLIIIELIILFSVSNKNEPIEPIEPINPPVNPVNEKNTFIFTLKGETIVNLEINSTYIEEGFIATYNDLDISNLVNITSDVKTDKVGTYTITYKISYNNEVKTLTRTVIVIDNNLDININIPVKHYTNESIKLEISIEGSEFTYLVLPNNVVKKQNNITYTIYNNGTYIFKAYNKKGQVFEKEVTISNIDKITPTGTCTATLENNNTLITVKASDNVGIDKYTYYDNGKELKNYSLDNYTHNKKTSKNITVKLTDFASNTANLFCNIIDNSYEEPILPKSNENIVFQDETNTLKVYISKFSTYYLTRVWVKNAHTQLNKFDSPEYGTNLYRPSSLLAKAIEQKKLQNKLLLGFNASGFYLKDEFDAGSVTANPAYNKTSVGTLVITDGKVIRNFYNTGDITTWFISGVDKNNKLVVFEDKKMKQTSVNEKNAWSKNVINSGIRNTYTFSAPVILNGKPTDYTSSNSRMPGSNSSNKGLQLICQINDNNFVLFTSTSSTRNTAINKFLDLGCQTAVNLDGGGSVALLYKDKNSSDIKTVTGNNRSLPEVAYFSE